MLTLTLLLPHTHRAPVCVNNVRAHRQEKEAAADHNEVTRCIISPISLKQQHQPSSSASSHRQPTAATAVATACRVAITHCLHRQQCQHKPAAEQDVGHVCLAACCEGAVVAAASNWHHGGYHRPVSTGHCHTTKQGGLRVCWYVWWHGGRGDAHAASTRQAGDAQVAGSC